MQYFILGLIGLGFVMFLIMNAKIFKPDLKKKDTKSKQQNKTTSADVVSADQVENESQQNDEIPKVLQELMQSNYMYDLSLNNQVIEQNEQKINDEKREKEYVEPVKRMEYTITDDGGPLSLSEILEDMDDDNLEQQVSDSKDENEILKKMLIANILEKNEK